MIIKQMILIIANDYQDDVLQVSTICGKYFYLNLNVICYVHLLTDMSRGGSDVT